VKLFQTLKLYLSADNSNRINKMNKEGAIIIVEDDFDDQELFKDVL
jgi:hypothetical protein